MRLLFLLFPLLLYLYLITWSDYHAGFLLDPDPPDKTDSCLPEDLEISQDTENSSTDMSSSYEDTVDDLPPTQRLLTDAEVVHYLMKHTNETLKDERKHTKEMIKDESDFTDDKIKCVIQGLSDLATSVTNFQRANKSEIDDMNLKVETVTMYQQDLVFNLKSGLVDTFHLVQEDMRAVWSRLQSLEEACHPRCTLCGEVFQSVGQLVEHAVSHHVSDTSLPNNSRIPGQRMLDRDRQQDWEKEHSLDVQTCYICALSFPTPHALQAHIEYYHRTEPYVNEDSSQEQQPYLCSLCGKMAPSLSQLEQHYLCTHNNTCSTPCANCDEIPTSKNLAELHSTTHDTVLITTPREDCSVLSPDLSPIHQYDGANDTLSDTHLPVPVRSDSGISNNVRVASYTMDRKKQVARLANDASIDDFDIVVSPNEHNVTIFCSTGFYSLVAIPTFSSILVGSSFTVLGMTVSCYDITGKVDSSHANVNTVFFFRVTSDTKSSMAKVTIHLHHTARKVQVQGGSLVDKKRAGVWFLQNFLLISFSQVAKDRALDITKFNDAVRGIVSNHVEKVGKQERCHICEIPFTGRSLRQTCSVCKKRFHKACLQSDQHLCLGAGPSDLHPGQPGSQVVTSRHTPSAAVATPPLQNMSPQNLSKARPSQQSILFISATAPNKPANTVLTPAATPVTEPPPCLTRSIVPPLTVVNPVPPPVLPPTPSLTVTTVSTTTTRMSTAPVNNAQNKVKKNASKHIPAIDEAGFEIECKKKQLVTAHAKIQELETEVTKLTKTNHILTERIKMFENRNERELYERYFPVRPPQPDTPTNTGHQSSAPCSHPHQCCPPPPCHWQMRCSGRQDTPHLIVRITELSEKIDQAVLDIAKLKSSQENLESAMYDNTRNATPCSPDIIIDENVDPVPDTAPDSMDLDTSQNISEVSDSNTIDENVEAGLKVSNLNSNLPTNQLPQLMHISPQEL